MIDPKIETLKRSWLFLGLSEEKLAGLSSCSFFRKIGKGQLLFNEGDQAEYLYIVSSGIVKQFKISPSGKIFTIVMNCSGDTLNMFALFGGKHYVSVEAITEAKVLCIPREHFLSFIERNPFLMARTIRAMSKLIDNAYKRLCDCAYERVYQRVLNIIFMLYRKFGETLPFSKEEIATMAGTTTETVVRILKSLETKHVIKSRRGGVTVVERGELHNVSEDSYVITLYSPEW
ncbi:MAG: Crp/Fnr family transcriptional regulator [Candidatus Methanomethyliaceae archaeon]